MRAAPLQLELVAHARRYQPDQQQLRRLRRRRLRDRLHHRYCRLADSDNTAAAAGGAVNSCDSSLTLADTTVINNSSDGYGGAVYAAGSTIAIARSRMADNAAAAAGGAVNSANSR